MKRSILIILIMFIFLTACSNSNNKKEAKEDNGVNITVTLKEYKKVKLGDSFENLKKIVGDYCVIERNKETFTYTCSGEMAGSYAIFKLKDNKIIEKKEEGLK